MDDITNFLDELFEVIRQTGIDVSDLKIDHIAYSASSTEEYEALLPKFLQNGQLIKEAIISDRRAAIIKLNSPIIYKNHSITAMEVIEPIKGEKSLNGWEHAEFLVNDYDSILSKYPNLSWNTANKNRPEFSRIKLILTNGMEIKFLDTPLLESAKQ